MKKYVVLLKVGDFPADECKEFDDIQQARAYRDSVAGKSCKVIYGRPVRYYVCEVIE